MQKLETFPPSRRDYHREYMRKRRADPNFVRWAEKHPEVRKEIANRSYHKHKDDSGAKERRSRSQAKSRAKVKMEVFIHYGGDPPKCANCETDDVDVLTIDHIDGNGHQHRKEIGNKLGYLFYRWLRQNNFPPGYRVLCRNCNWLHYIGRI
ncbi:MAG: hypothetical protein OEY81_07050 [Candidatus Bathyarchaeota archaeon]|nr:hypothetical protein [Candidatus Bathyarchaeota archaeon]